MAYPIALLLSLCILTNAASDEVVWRINRPAADRVVLGRLEAPKARGHYRFSTETLPAGVELEIDSETGEVVLLQARRHREGFSFVASASQLARKPGLRINQLQVVGTHNSYHVAPRKETLKLIKLVSKNLGRSISYSHKPLAEQLGRLRMRQLELDVFADPKGGRFAGPWSKDERMSKLMGQPGLKVLHFPGFDYRTTVATFEGALRIVRDWSRKNPGHLPLMVLVEAKERGLPFGPIRPIPFDERRLASIDEEIRTVFERKDLITPDRLRGAHASVREAIRKRGWPLLAHVRGKILFALDNSGGVRDRYLRLHPGLRAAMMFATVGENDPAAAFFKKNSPRTQFEKIRELVRAGYIVRTRADSGLDEGRRNATDRRAKALASGAQYISTDFPEPRQGFSKYAVRIPGNAAGRINPVNARTKGALGELAPAVTATSRYRVTVKFR